MSIAVEDMDVSPSTTHSEEPSTLFTVPFPSILFFCISLFYSDNA